MGIETPNSQEGQGRNFSAEMRNVSSRIDRSDSLRVGDYINIDPKDFATWAGTVLEGNLDNLKGRESIRITVESISYQDEAKRNPENVIVSCDGVRRQVPASLFYNYNRPPNPAHGSIVVTDMPTDNYGPPMIKLAARVRSTWPIFYKVKGDGGMGHPSPF